MRSLTKDAPDHQGPRNDWKTLKTLLPYLWPQGAKELRFRVLVALVLLAAAKATNVSVPLFYREAIDGLSLDGATGLIVVPIMMLVAYGLARVMAQAFGELRDAVFARVAQRAIRDVALKTFKHLHRLALRFHVQRQTGGLTRSIERGTKGIDFLLNFMLFNILPTLLEIVLVCGILWALYGWTFAVVTFGTIAGYIAWTLIVTEWRIKYRRTMNKSDNEANTKAVDSLLNFETVKYFTNEDHEARRYDVALRSYEGAAIKSKVTLSLLNIGQGAIISIGLTAVMIMAGFGVQNGSMTLGDFVLVNSYLIQLYMPLNFLGFVYREIKQSLIDMEHMFSLLNQEAEISDDADAVDLPAGGGDIVFENVSFAYDARRPILKSVNFHVPAGKTCAIVGSSGAGKSTLSRLLFRFYDVSDGVVKIDGSDIRTIKQNALRGAIGIVPQDTVLFNDTVYYNIAYGRPDATPGDVEEAAKLARIHDFIMELPDGYNTTVGERGLKLSGGEKQRVAIARTILKKPRILLFDEATSALDTHTEKEIQVSLREVSSGLTTLVIAHRLSTVVDADEIIVLEKGEIVERGNHTVLLAQAGAYAAMWEKQQEAAQALETLEKAGVEAEAVLANVGAE